MGNRLELAKKQAAELQDVIATLRARLASPVKPSVLPQTCQVGICRIWGGMRCFNIQPAYYLLMAHLPMPVLHYHRHWHMVSCMSGHVCLHKMATRTPSRAWTGAIGAQVCVL